MPKMNELTRVKYLYFERCDISGDEFLQSLELTI
jgi:hypothetical protein